MIDPTRAAIPTHPLCAASGLKSGQHHRVSYDVDRYAVWADGHVWRFCSPRCLTAWSRALAGRAS